VKKKCQIILSFAKKKKRKERKNVKLSENSPVIEIGLTGVLKVLDSISSSEKSYLRIMTLLSRPFQALYFL
jgi:hypothetical protein